LNPYREDLVFKSNHPELWRRIADKKIICPSLEFIVIPHRYWTVTFACGWEGFIPVHLLMPGCVELIQQGKTDKLRPKEWELAKIRAKCAHRGDCGKT